MTKKTIVVPAPDPKVSVDHWRDQFSDLHQRAGTYTLKNLVPFDSYFRTTEGKSAMSNVRMAIAGVAPTMRVCKALEKLIASREPRKKRLSSRQNLALS
jgi:CO/xanthine dehydrogenase FAD-binding subunit